MEGDKIDLSQQGLYATIDWVVNEEIKGFYQQALENAPPEFWKAPASSSGKYHGPENNIKGGLANVHTVKAVMAAFEFAEHEYSQMPAGKKNLMRDVCVVAAGCHDIKKGGEPWDRYDPEHGPLAAGWLCNFPLEDAAKEMIAEAVYYHMNRLHPDWERKKALHPKRHRHVLIVQYADIAASRKAASYLPGVPVSGGKIRAYSAADVRRARGMLWERES